MSLPDIKMRYDPYFAGLDGKTPEQISTIEERIEQLPDSAKDVLLGQDTAGQILLVMDEAGVPATYAEAIAKIIFFILLGDVPVTSTNDLLQKIGLNPTQAETLSLSITKDVLEPVIAERGAKATPKMNSTELPPMTRPLENGPKPLTSSVPKSKVPEQNVINLRKTE